VLPCKSVLLPLPATCAGAFVLQCVELKSDWAKGYSRLGAAYYGLQEWENAIKAYEDGEQLVLLIHMPAQHSTACNGLATCANIVCRSSMRPVVHG
jgi:hypothetical protein